MLEVALVLVKDCTAHSARHFGPNCLIVSQMWDPESATESSVEESSALVVHGPSALVVAPQADRRATNRRPVGIPELRRRLNRTKQEKLADQERIRRRGGRPRPSQLQVAATALDATNRHLSALFRPVGRSCHLAMSRAPVRLVSEEPGEDVVRMIDHCLGETPRLSMGPTAGAALLNLGCRKTHRKDVLTMASMVYCGSVAFLASCCSHLHMALKDRYAPVACIVFRMYDETPMKGRTQTNDVETWKIF